MRLPTSDQEQPWSHLAPLLRYGEILAENCNFFLPYFHLTPSLGVNFFEILDDFSPRLESHGLSVGEDFVILACVVLAQRQRVTNRQADIQTDGQHSTVANTGL